MNNKSHHRRRVHDDESHSSFDSLSDVVDAFQTAPRRRSQQLAPRVFASSSSTHDVPEDAVENTEIQCYPNPASDEVSFRFDLKQQQNLSFEIYNQAGQLVSRIDCGVKDAGNHHISWKISSINNTVLPSGIYYVKLVSQHQNSGARFILMK